MNSNKLHAIIINFWDKENRDTRYYLGFCSEVAAALDKFMNKKGKIGKHGWFHTIYIYDGYYWDIRGKMSKNKLDMMMPIGATDEPRPAYPNEIKHIYSLLNKRMYNKILNGLKQSKKELENATKYPKI